MGTGPQTLLEAVQYFADEENCIKYLAAKRWPDGVAVCPICGKRGAGFLAKQKRWQCSNRHPLRQFSIKVGTIMEDSPIGLDKWLPAIWLICSNRNGISSWELHRALKITQKTAWFMLQRIRLAMQDETTGGKLGGEVEVDETFIGGKARNMHGVRKARIMQGKRGGADTKPSSSECWNAAERFVLPFSRIAPKPKCAFTFAPTSNRAQRFSAMTPDQIGQ